MKKLLFILYLMGACIPIAYYYVQPSNEKSIGIINPVDVNPEMVAPELRKKGMNHIIENFQFLNQNGKLVKSKDIEGKIWVVEYFFATCLGICPIMNEQMKRVQSAYEKDTNVVILSFTVDPDKDSIKALKEYAVNHGAIDGKWHFFTGDKKELYALARNSFFVLKPAEAKNLGDAGSDFIHTNNFVLVDQKKRIRGYYDGTNPKEVDSLIQDISILRNKEPNNSRSSFPWIIYLTVMGLFTAVIIFFLFKNRNLI